MDYFRGSVKRRRLLPPSLSLPFRRLVQETPEIGTIFTTLLSLHIETRGVLPLLKCNTFAEFLFGAA